MVELESKSDGYKKQTNNDNDNNIENSHDTAPRN